MTANATDLLAAFNAATQAINPASPTQTDMLGAINKLTDALTTFAAANTGDQTITLTGDVTGSGTGSFAATLGAGKVTAAKIANTAFRLLVFTGADASVTPAAATLTGAKVGDVVIGIVNLTDAAISSVFESVITVADQIQQASADLSTKTLMVLLIAKGA